MEKIAEHLVNTRTATTKIIMKTVVLCKTDTRTTNLIVKMMIII